MFGFILNFTSIFILLKAVYYFCNQLSIHHKKHYAHKL
nr:MAG TPA: hypothetical protein [Caudoviricetes sp.]